MKRIVLFFLIVLQHTMSNAQLKVGKNVKNINNNSQFEVESNLSNFFVVTKDSAKVGIGNTMPKNKLEITQGISGNSGLRFTNLINSNIAQSSSSINQKFLSVNSSGDVVLANSVDQVITVMGLASGLVSPVATPTFQAGTFESNYSKTDSTVIYVNQTDGTQWIYTATGGGQYKSYIAPASTEWYLANSMNDAGSSKTASIYRKGNIGINASTPLTSLHIAGTSPALSHGLLLEENGSINPRKWVMCARSDVPAFAISDETSGYLRFSIFNSTGNVGIGTELTSPQSRLEILGNNGLTVTTKDTGLQKMITLKSGIATDSISDWVLYKADAKSAYKPGLHLLSYPKNGTSYGSCCNPRMALLDNGNIGIGTLSPTWNLDVRKNSSASELVAQFINTSTATSAESNIGIGAGPGSFSKLVGYNNTLGIRNYSTGVELMTFKMSGNIGIGNMSPSYPLHIKSSNGISLYVETTAGDPNGALAINVPSSNTICGPGQLSCSELIMFQAAGVNIGSITPTNSGTGIQYLTTSDIRLKENIKSTNKTIDDIMKLNVVNYNFKSDTNKVTETGFIAQNLYNVIPAVVKVGTNELDRYGLPTKPWMVDYSRLTPILVKAVQDLKFELDNQIKLKENLNEKIRSQQLKQKILEEKLESQSKIIMDLLNDIELIKSKNKIK